jgi:hypothetical protein
MYYHYGAVATALHIAFEHICPQFYGTLKGSQRILGTFPGSASMGNHEQGTRVLRSL